MSRRVLVIIALGALLAAACSRADTLGVEEAVEVMVLDGVDRERATCVVSALDGALDFEKVTGLDPDLDDAELLLLSGAAGECAPAIGGGGGVVGGGGAPGLDPIAALADHDSLDPSADVDALVDGLVLGGLEPAIGACLVDRILNDDDPASIVGSDERLGSMIVDCRSDALSETSR